MILARQVTPVQLVLLETPAIQDRRVKLESLEQLALKAKRDPQGRPDRRVQQGQLGKRDELGKRDQRDQPE